MMFPKWLLLFSAVVNGVRVAARHASVDTQDAGASATETSGNVGTVEGKVIKCIVGDTVVFEQTEDASVFKASLEYADDETGTTAWVVTITGVLQVVVDSESMMLAQLGDWFVPKSYITFPTAVDPTGKAMQDSLTGTTNNWIEKVRIIRGSPTTVKIIAKRRQQKKNTGNVEIEFTGGPGPVEARVELPALEYRLPIQGAILRMNLDGRTLFDKANSELIFPVVCTPAFFNIPGPAMDPARGLSVDFVGFTYFWVRKSEMEMSGNFTPISHGYSTPNNEEITYLEMLAGFQRWHETTTRLTIRSDTYTVEISGSGLDVVFSKDKVEGKVTKCIESDGSVVFDKAEKESAISASLSYVHNPKYISGWAINIPSIVRIFIKEPFSVASKTEKLENKFRTTLIICDTSNSNALDPSEQRLRGVFCSEAIDMMSITYKSHKSIKIAAHRWTSGEIFHVEFTRGPGAAMADDFVTHDALTQTM